MEQDKNTTPQAPAQGEPDDGGDAFPLPATPEMYYHTSYPGMSLRDYLAAKAMASLIIDPARADQSREECARLSYLMADSMLKARKAAPHA